MKRLRVLRIIWAGFLSASILYGVVGWWLGTGRPGLDPANSPLAAGLVVIAAAALVGAAGVYVAKWRPLCEQALKLVWAGRLTSPTGAREVTGRLARLSIVMMALCELPGILAVVLGGSGFGDPTWIMSLVGASMIALGLFYWYGLLPSSGVFEHAERIAKP